MRTTLAAGIIFGWLFSRNRTLLAVDRSDLPYFVSLGVGLAAVQFTYLFAISRVQVAAAILIQYQAPLFVALYTVALLRTKLPPAVFAAMAGVALRLLARRGGLHTWICSAHESGGSRSRRWPPPSPSRGTRCAASTGMKAIPPWTVSFYVPAVRRRDLEPPAPPLTRFLAPSGPVQWGSVLVVGFLGTVLAFICYNEGIKRIGATRASITATLEPITAGLIAWLLLGETMEVWQVLGAALVVASIIGLQMSRKPAEQG